ncbi:hypothetical protein [Micromonospora sp. ATCC 39149]|uniref:Uncharacterized protein n=1 Tax=Micromonospora carbonacea TaxID=47853 RepID=A0A7D6C7I8_9ACTN|nr:hypothetical protein [Micromonospora sp. ATCC 39149]QLJ98867.1 hypothetical protein HZU44_01215 [Micromonospora carbonacea]
MRTRIDVQHFVKIRSHLATAGKYDIGILNALNRLAKDQPWLRQPPE